MQNIIDDIFDDVYNGEIWCTLCGNSYYNCTCGSGLYCPECGGGLEECTCICPREEKMGGCAVVLACDHE